MKNMTATIISAAALPIALGANIAHALSRTGTNSRYQRLSLEKGQTAFYTDPVSGRREQLMAVAHPIDVAIPQTQISILPAPESSRRVITR